MNSTQAPASLKDSLAAAMDEIYNELPTGQKKDQQVFRRERSSFLTTNDGFTNLKQLLASMTTDGSLSTMKNGQTINWKVTMPRHRDHVILTATIHPKRSTR